MSLMNRRRGGGAPNEPVTQVYPLEATDEMVSAGAMIQGGYDPLDLRAVWRAMAAVAPTPPAIDAATVERVLGPFVYYHQTGLKEPTTSDYEDAADLLRALQPSGQTEPQAGEALMRDAYGHALRAEAERKDEGALTPRGWFEAGWRAALTEAPK